MRWYLWAWKLCLTITLMQHNASVIRQLFSLKNTYSVLKITTHYLAFNMHLDVMQRIILKQLHFIFPTFMELVLFSLCYWEETGFVGQRQEEGELGFKLGKGNCRAPAVLESFCHHKWLPGGIIRHKLIFMLLFLHPFWNGEQLQFAQPLI